MTASFLSVLPRAVLGRLFKRLALCLSVVTLSVLASAQIIIIRLPNKPDTPPTIVEQPTDTTRFDGGWVTLICNVTGDPFPTIRWERRAAGTSTWVVMQDRESPTVVGSSTTGVGFTATHAMNGDEFRCIASNGAGTVVSRIAQLTVIPIAPRFSTFGTSHAVLAGTDITLSVGVMGTEPRTYQWLRNGEPIDGANALTLSLPAAQITDEGNYQLVVTNHLGTATSPTMQVAILQPPVIVRQPKPLVVATGDLLRLDVEGTSAYVTFNYLWRRNGVPIPGANNWFYSTSAQPSDAGTYDVQLTNVAGTTTSVPVTVEVVAARPPEIEVGESATRYVPFGGTTTLAQSVKSSFATTYQWYRNGAPLTGATSENLTLANFSLADVGEYFLVATNAVGTTVGRTIHVEPATDGGGAATEWIDARQDGDVVYFLFADTPRIMRYDLQSRDWLASWSLDFTPVAFEVTPDAFYVAGATNVRRYDRLFASGTPLATELAGVRAVRALGEQLVVIDVNQYNTLTARTLSRHTGAPLASRGIPMGPTQSFSIDPVARQIIGRSGSAQAPITVPINPDGTFGEVRFNSPLGGESFGRTWLLEVGEAFVETSGLVWDTNTLARVAHLGRNVADATPDGFGGWVTLRHGRLARLDAQFRETGAFALGWGARRVWTHEGVVFCFAPAANAAQPPQVVARSLTELAPVPLAAPVSPAQTPLWSAQVESDGDAFIYFYSKLHRNIVRWSVREWAFASSLPTTGSGDVFALSPQRRVAYVAANPYQLGERPLDHEASALTPTVNTPDSISGVQDAGGLLFVTSHNPFGGQQLHSVYDDTGVVRSQTGGSSTHRFTWDAMTRSMYFLRERGSPLELFKQSISPTGVLGQVVDSPYHGEMTALVRHPVRVSPDGNRLMLGSGRLFRGDDLTFAGEVPRTVTDALWTSDRLITMRPAMAGTQLELWSADDLSLLKTVVVSGAPLRVVELRGDRVIAVTSDSAGRPQFHAFDAAELNAIDPSAVQAAPEIARRSVPTDRAVGSLFQAWVMTRGGAWPDYQWQVRQAGSAEWVTLVDDGVLVSGARTARLTIAELPAEFAGARFRVVVSNPGGVVTSETVSLGMSGRAPVHAIAASGSHYAIADAAGTTWVAGRNFEYELGTGTRTDVTAPWAHPIAAAAVFAGYGHLAFLQPDGSLWGTGEGSWFAGSGPASRPRLIGPEYVAAAFGFSHTLLLDRRGILWGVGASYSGQLGVVTQTGVPLRQLAAGVIAIAAAEQTTYWITADGTLWGMGRGDVGQLGATQSANNPDPVMIAADVQSVSTGGGNVVYVKRDGTAWRLGQLFQSPALTSPVQIASEVVQVAASSSHLLLLKSDGSVWSMGDNAVGQLGDGTVTRRETPVRVAGDAAQVAVGSRFSLVLKRDGSVWFCGNLFGELSAEPRWRVLHAAMAAPPPLPGALTASETSPMGVVLHWLPVVGATHYEVWRSASDDFAAAALLLRTNGVPLAIDGSAEVGVRYHYWVRAIAGAKPSAFTALASGARRAPAAPVITQQPQDAAFEFSGSFTVQADSQPLPTYRWQERAPGAADWTDVSDQWPHSGATTATLAISQLTAERSGTRFRCVVANATGAVTSAEVVATRLVSPPTLYSQPVDRDVRAGESTWFQANLAAPRSPTYQWRRNGIAIPGATEASFSIASATAADAGEYSVVITDVGGTITSAAAVLTVRPAAAVTAVASSYHHSVFAQANRIVRGMGDNAWGRTSAFGSGSIVPPRSNDHQRDFIAVAAGFDHSMFLTGDGAVHFAGANTYGQTLGSSFFTLIAANNAAQIAAGHMHSVVLKKDGTAWAAGYNASGQIGDGTQTNRSSLHQFASGVSSIATGPHLTLFVKDDGTLWGMGNNANSQLGSNNSTLLLPVQLATNVAAAAAGDYHTVYLRRDGELWGLGWNSQGQLGSAVPLGATYASPAQIATGVVGVAAGGEQTAFIKADGTLWVLGRNDNGQLGTGDWDRRTVPVQVATNVRKVAVGAAQMLFIDATGALWGTGRNASGQLGFPTGGADVNAPQRLAETEAVAPAAPRNVSATDGGTSGGIRVSWDGVAGAEGYEIWRHTEPTITGAVRVAEWIETPLFFDATVPAGLTHHYWVVARNAAGRSPFSQRETGLHGIAGVPVITSQPATNLNYTAGGFLNLFVGYTSGSTSSVQWRRNGVAISGATANSYSKFNLTSADAGDYDVVITNAAGSVQSRSVPIVVHVGGQSMAFESPGLRVFSPAPFNIGPAASTAGLPIHYSVVSGPATVSGNQLTLTGIGSVSVRATQAGNEEFSAASEIVHTFEVIPSAASVSLHALTKTYSAQPHAAQSSTIPAGLPVVLTYDGSSTLPTQAGTYLVRASIADPRYHGSQVAMLTIHPATQTISFSPPATLPASGAAHDLEATATSQLPVSFALVSGSAALHGNRLSSVAPGTVVVRATQPGDENFDPAPDVLGAISFTAADPSVTWRHQHFVGAELEDAGVSGWLADPDADGLTNLLEYALGRDPRVAEREPALSVEFDDGRWVCTYRRPAARPDLVYRLEYSPDLSSWDSAGLHLERTAEEGEMETWSTVGTTASTPRVFFRLQVERSGITVDQ